MPPTAPVGRPISLRTAPVGRPISLRFASPRPVPLADLCDEARRLAHRRCRAEAAVRRLRAHPAHERLGRLAAHSDRLLVGFHRSLDRIVAADGFDEALEIFRDYRATLVQADGPSDASGMTKDP
ncbi:hypothetical protein [Tautonia plasticadhaerens]|uniref:Uncharacterized protein n=1 Tax=Tautonia plasticadhaerens TaxID=2527974 RepID=A0A518H4I1_9BACT|nr:hypothetical protein [Tautonia plasticadhaerens]QDV35738.1 hypothetical protein ElP_36440 [Tautonia plasticadhaerens]